MDGTIDWAVVSRSFTWPGDFVSAVPHGNGHINDTYAVTVDQAGTRVRYLLQRLNGRVFPDPPRVMENVHRVTAHLAAGLAKAGARDASRRALAMVPARDGRPWYRDAAGACWRAYLFIEGAASHDRPRHPRDAMEAARAFGAFQYLLASYDGPRLHETIPGFHDTPGRYGQFRRVLAADPHGRGAEAGREIDFALSREPLGGRLAALRAAGELPERITHNDTKLNNVMLDDRTGEGICVVDLDTVMPGSALYDFGDLVRSTLNPVAEDQSAGEGPPPVDEELFEAIARGFWQGTAGSLTRAEQSAMVTAGMVLTLECGVRFLTDHLNGDQYFRTHRTGQNLDRCRSQFALLRALESARGRLESIVADLPPVP